MLVVYEQSLIFVRDSRASVIRESAGKLEALAREAMFSPSPSVTFTLQGSVFTIKRPTRGRALKLKALARKAIQSLPPRVTLYVVWQFFRGLPHLSLRTVVQKRLRKRQIGGHMLNPHQTSHVVMTVLSTGGPDVVCVNNMDKIG